MPRRMDDAEWRAFVSGGARIGKLDTTRHDGHAFAGADIAG